MKPEGWDVAFDDPVPLPGGGALKTLRDARDYAAKLSAAKRRRPEWNEAVMLLEKAATVDRAWCWFARSSVYAAIHGADQRATPEPAVTKAELFKARRRAWKAQQAAKRHGD